MKPDEFKALIKEFGSLIDARAKTTEMIVKAETKSSEERVGKRIEERKKRYAQSWPHKSK